MPVNTRLSTLAPFHNTCNVNTNLPYGRKHGHLSHPDFVEPGLTGGVAEEVHLFAGVGDRVERCVAPRPQLSRQQLMRQLLLFAVALTEYPNCALFELPRTNIAMWQRYTLCYRPSTIF